MRQVDVRSWVTELLRSFNNVCHFGNMIHLENRTPEKRYHSSIVAVKKIHLFWHYFNTTMIKSELPSGKLGKLRQMEFFQHPNRSVNGILVALLVVVSCFFND